MDKVSAEKFAQVLRDAEATLRAVCLDRDKLAAKCAAFERREEAQKVASEMHNKGLELDVTFEDLVGRLEKEAEAGNLPAISTAVNLIGPNMSIGTPSNHDETAGGISAFESFLVGSVG